MTGLFIFTVTTHLPSGNCGFGLFPRPLVQSWPVAQSKQELHEYEQRRQQKRLKNVIHEGGGAVL